MNYTQTLGRLKALGEEHLLRYYEELSEAERAALLAQLETLDFSYLELFRSRNRQLEGVSQPESASQAADASQRSGASQAAGASQQSGASQPPPPRFAPLPPLHLAEIRAGASSFREAGLAAARRGELAAVLLAGGMGTRLGVFGPKGVCDIGVTRHVYIFQRIFENLMEAADEIGRSIHLFIMTSESNHEESAAFLEKHDFFGYDRDFVHFFIQDMAPAVDDEGRVFLETKGRVATSPNGNGGWFSSMQRAGYAAFLEENGISWLNVFNVDNVLQRICDPVFFGAVLRSGCASGAKVVGKASPDEKVGVICLENGRPSVVEYYDMTEELRRRKNADGSYAYYFGVIGNYLFRVEELVRAAGSSLPVHFARKAVPHVGESGEIVRPKSPNGWKFEYFIFDILRELNGCLPFEVEREKEFAPVKNAAGADSVDTARELLRRNHIEI